MAKFEVEFGSEVEFESRLIIFWFQPRQGGKSDSILLSMSAVDLPVSFTEICLNHD